MVSGGWAKDEPRQVRWGKSLGKKSLNLLLLSFIPESIKWTISNAWAWKRPSRSRTA